MGHPQDICACGDYRSVHENGTGACKLNDLGHGGAPACEKFEIAIPAGVGTATEQRFAEDRKNPPPNAPKAVTSIPSTMTTITADGRSTDSPMAWGLVPPPDGHCPICAAKHEPELPHNKQSLFYQMAFESVNGRAATWADAAAHCSSSIRDAWQTNMHEVAPGEWNEPPDGVEPIAHHGLKE